MRVALISPKGPLYRYRGGLLRKSLRYQPLTLTTLTALAPPELGIEFVLIDEGIEDIPSTLDVDLVGMTVITGTAPRAYELAARMRAAGTPVVLGGPHVTLVPDEAAEHADAICVGYAEESWPRLLRDFAAGQMRARYDQGANFALDQLVIPERHRLDRGRYITQGRVRGDACVRPCLRVLRRALRLGPQAVPEARQPRGRGHPALRRQAQHLRRSQPHLRQGLRVGPVRRARPAAHPLVRPGHEPDRARPRADGADGRKRLLGRADRLREHLARRAGRRAQGLQPAGRLRAADRRAASLGHLHLRLLRVRR